MPSLLNPDRPPVFCPGCSHERIVKALDRTFQAMGLSGDGVVLVSDIGCSGLFDTFFHTHAFHGLHGRALTYATGIKMVRPDLHVVVTMGDGGLGIGGAHVLSTCRRNIDLTLLVLNNFNYGMTGGQCSATTPREAQVGSGFLNRLEQPLDVCRLAEVAGAGFVARASTYDKELVGIMERAVAHPGFSVVDIHGICPGRYTRRNRIGPADIEAGLRRLPPLTEAAPDEKRTEYATAYREEAARLAPPPPPARIKARLSPVGEARQEIVLLGSAGQRIVTAGELLCLAGAAAGLNATQKNDYPITVMRGHSVSELILSAEPVGYTGIRKPTAVVALAPEGVARKRGLLADLSEDALLLHAAGVEVPETRGSVRSVDFRAMGIKSPDWALASLAVLARENRVLSPEMLQAALELRFRGTVREAALSVVHKVLDPEGGKPTP